METNEPLKIIIVDDDLDDKELLNYLFDQNESFKLLGCFDSGKDVIKEILINRNIPDVLLIDMYMPVMTGIEVIKKLEESGVAPNMFKFIISTTINDDEQAKYLDNPSVKFIEKPITMVGIHDLPGIVLESLHHYNNTKV